MQIFVKCKGAPRDKKGDVWNRFGGHCHDQNGENVNFSDPLAATLHMLLSEEILTLEGPSSLLRVRFELIKHDIMSMCGHGTCVNIVVSAFARFFIVCLLFLAMLFLSVFWGLVFERRKSEKSDRY